ADDRPGRQSQLAQPVHVGEVAEGAAHRDTGAEARVRRDMGEDGHLYAEQGNASRHPERLRVARVVWMCDECHASREQLGTRRLYVNGLAAAAIRANTGKRDTVPGTRPVAVFKLSLRHRGTERDIPQARRLGQIGFATAEVAQE